MQIKVLVVEDDLHTRQGLVEILRQEGCLVVQASNGIHGWESYCREHPDFVCLDVMMPGMSGYELCKKIRATDNKTPIMFLTAKTEEIDRVLGLELGGDDYLCKPFGLKEVVARVRAITRRTLGDRAVAGPLDKDHIGDIPAEFVMGDLVCYPQQLRCRRGDGESIDLSLRDMKILLLYFETSVALSIDGRSWNIAGIRPTFRPVARLTNTFHNCESASNAIPSHRRLFKRFTASATGLIRIPSIVMERRGRI